MSLLPLRRGGSSVPVRRGDVSSPSTELTRIDPWNDFDAMDRIFDSFFRAPFSVLGRNMGQRPGQSIDPNVELYETPEDLVAYVYAPGIPQDAFDINVTDDTISIKAERKPLFQPGENTTSHTPWSNFAVGTSTFNASYTLPIPVDSSRVQATYKDGVLMVKMPKSEAAKPKQIKVQVQNG